MLALPMTFGRSPRAAEFRLFCVMLVGRPSRAVRIGSNSMLRSQRGPEILYWIAAVKLLGRSNALTARSTLGDTLGNSPSSNTSGCETLNRPEPSSVGFDVVQFATNGRLLVDWRRPVRCSP